MLAGDFFILHDVVKTDNTISANLTLNTAHQIFKGHFPGQPVVPGVCMMQMIKEIVESATGKKTRLAKSDHAKFLSMIVPRDNKIIKAELKYSVNENGEIQVVASLFDEGVICLKYKALFVV